jgi:DNA polymerase III alpha subunit
MPTTYEFSRLIREKVMNNLADKFEEVNTPLLDRVFFELSEIEDKGCAEYFYIYSLIIEICNRHNILRSPGRGNACCSLVNYCLDITKINPIEYKLDPDRFFITGDFYDIDIDVTIVAQKIIADELEKILPDYKIRRLLYKTDERDPFKAKNRVGNSEYIFHPTAIMVARDIPVEYTNQYMEIPTFIFSNKKYDPVLEKFKFDALELSILDQLTKMTEKIESKYHPYNLKPDDPEVYKKVFHQDMDLILYFHNNEYNSWLSKTIKPENLDELSVVLALGYIKNMDVTQELIDHKVSGKGFMCFSDDKVSEILQKTYGVILFQEDFIKLASVAGVDPYLAEKFRRRIKNKSKDNCLESFEAEFRQGCLLKTSLNSTEIDTLTKKMIKSAEYTFLRSHCLAHSLLVYWGAYYKTYYQEVVKEIYKEYL